MSALRLISSYGSDSESEDADGGQDIKHTVDTAERFDHKEDKDFAEPERSHFFEVNADSDSEGEQKEIFPECAAVKPSTHQTSVYENPFRITKLDNPARHPSVFANPFKEAEHAELLSLEKHVKLAPKLDDVKEINGRKICWNYRKGRCRFGLNCIFAHDSELLQSNRKHTTDSSLDTTCNHIIESHVDVKKGNKRNAFQDESPEGKKLCKKK